MTGKPDPETESGGRTFRGPLLIAVAAVLSLLFGLVLASRLDAGGAGVLSKYPGVGGDFSLESANGPVALADLRGKAVVVYFGYASCPDVCPASLAAITAAIRKLKPDLQTQVQPVFISVDPPRDTPALLASYVHAFDPGMIGLTGSKQQIDKVTAQYKAYYALVPQQDSAGDYIVNHTSATYVIDRNGLLQDILGHGSPVGALTKALQQVLG